MHVLLTRPEQDAEPLKTCIEELGCRVTSAPLMEIVANDIDVEAFRGATAVVATSRNALAALAASPSSAVAVQLPLYVVGPGTAAVARSMGFRQVIEGPGSGEGLVPILSSETGDGKRLIYLKGDVLAFDLEAALGQRGVPVTPVQAYRSVAAERLPEDVIKALQTGGIDAVVLMSPRTARIWDRLVGSLSPPVQLGGVAYLCLSERVAGALGPSPKAGKVLVAGQANAEEMLALVKRLAASSKAE